MITSYSFKSFLVALSLAALSPVSFAQQQTAPRLPAAWGLPPTLLIAAGEDSMPEAPLPQGLQDSQAASQQNAQEPVPQNSQPPVQTDRDRARQQVKQQEKQRILGVVPNFNTSYVSDAVPLSKTQKFALAFHSAIDPFVFVAAAADAGLSQAENSFPEYGQGSAGFAKRFGASYMDDFDGTMLGNALFPALLKQDPRYFRKGTGTFGRRLFYALATTVWCKNDNGKWGPNYSNVLGNLAAGGISNLYYPASDRGAGLTIERGLTVTAEGTIGGVLDEFWPDVANRIFKNHMKGLQPNLPPPSAAN